MGNWAKEFDTRTGYIREKVLRTNVSNSDQRLKDLRQQFLNFTKLVDCTGKDEPDKIKQVKEEIELTMNAMNDLYVNCMNKCNEVKYETLKKKMQALVDIWNQDKLHKTLPEQTKIEFKQLHKDFNEIVRADKGENLNLQDCQERADIYDEIEKRLNVLKPKLMEKRRRIDLNRRIQDLVKIWNQNELHKTLPSQTKREFRQLHKDFRIVKADKEKTLQERVDVYDEIEKRLNVLKPKLMGKRRRRLASRSLKGRLVESRRRRQSIKMALYNHW